jgi:molybdenum cofactor guanylyltransferase
MSKHQKDGLFDRPENYLYHPYEFFFCGFSNSGKTTLMSRVIEHLSQDYEVGCVKHCSHSFDFDREGKDSWKFTQAGAQSVILNAPGRWAIHNQMELDKFEASTLLNSLDFVLAEGAKEQLGDKILVIDKDLAALELLKQGEISGVKALVGEAQPEETYGLPFFHRDDIEAVSQFIIENLLAKAPPLKVLLLTGGKSTRMGQDKAFLKYHGISQLQYMYNLLAPVGEVKISCRDKVVYPGFEESVYLEDRYHGLGPLGGILTAISEDAKSAWLVAAVDLPYVDNAALTYLIENRNPFKTATAYKSNFKDFPEPLLTIYEPHSRHRIFKFMGQGYSCPRKVLINSSVELLEQQDPRWLDNANTPEEFAEICRMLKK